MAVIKIKPIKSTLKKALEYIQNPDKTDDKMLVSSFGCSYETADIEFAFTLSQALDKGNNLAHHLIQSFEPGEVSFEKAHEIGNQLADAVTKGQYEYVLTTHIDKGHVHNHIIFCAVNFVDYHKYNSNKRSYYGIRNISDRLCYENGLSVITPEKGRKGKSYIEYQTAKIGTSWKGKLKEAVDLLIPQVTDFEKFLEKLQASGYEIKHGKYVSCRAPGQERFTRLKTLGADYTEEAIRKRIAGIRSRNVKIPKQEQGISLLIDIENNIKLYIKKVYIMGCHRDSGRSGHKFMAVASVFFAPYVTQLNLIFKDIDINPLPQAETLLKSKDMQGIYALYFVTRLLFFRILSAACFPVIFFLQSEQYFALLDFDAKGTPHMVQRRFSSGA